MAGLLKDEDRPVAKRHLLDALADSPRYQEAHSLLLEIAGSVAPDEKAKTDEEEAAAVSPEAL